MGIFRSASNAITSIFDTVTDVGQHPSSKRLHGHHLVHNRAVSQKLTDKQEVMVSTAETLAALQTKLDADEKLAAIYASLEKEFS
ncbi:hypothetical protein [Silicibacter phage DSS3phi2]|uniref:Uncharacterized protein n=1 Tax=Silicibacter phage DSS3phi2 TaxID=490912 RepID=C4NT03_9CAUD|nr:hypothetical protein DSS3P2_gp01 [Silicibacter phage DSS3phi2]ACL81269.1 hypothetical protein [Silicibacter phage DSS3phi2]